MKSEKEAAMKLAIVVSRQYENYLGDDRYLIDALVARGVEPVATVWDDATVDWAAYDALVIRTPWDYYRRIDEFLAWLARVEALGATLINPARTLRWNADKRYLIDLERDGWDVVETHWVERGADETLAAIVESRGWDEVVFKPAISGGAWKTERVRAADVANVETVFRRVVSEGDVLVQPYLPEVAEAGEWSLLFFGGEYSHAVLKQPKSGDFRVQAEFGGAQKGKAPPAFIIEAARRGLARLPALGHPGCLYARVDGVIVGGVFQLMELELIEPQLFFVERPESGAMYADVLIRAVSGSRA